MLHVSLRKRFQLALKASTYGRVATRPRDSPMCGPDVSQNPSRSVWKLRVTRTKNSAISTAAPALPFHLLPCRCGRIWACSNPNLAQVVPAHGFARKPTTCCAGRGLRSRRPAETEETPGSAGSPPRCQAPHKAPASPELTSGLCPEPARITPEETAPLPSPPCPRPPEQTSLLPGRMTLSAPLTLRHRGSTVPAAHLPHRYRRNFTPLYFLGQACQLLSLPSLPLMQPHPG